MALGQKTGGREAGTPNKATAKARTAIADFVDGNIDRLNSWLDQIAKRDGPKAAFDCFMDVVEYHVPKLQRAEHIGDPDNPIEHSHKVTFIG